MRSDAEGGERAVKKRPGSWQPGAWKRLARWYDLAGYQM